MRNPRREARASVSLAGDAENPTPKPLSRQAKWQAANPKARWAHVALQSALRRGIIERQPCSVCSDEKTHGHHPDYDRPAHVIWLCAKHHKQAHREARNGN